MHTDPLLFAYHYQHTALQRADLHRIAAAARAARRPVDPSSRPIRRRWLPLRPSRTAAA